MEKDKVRLRDVDRESISTNGIREQRHEEKTVSVRWRQRLALASVYFNSESFYSLQLL